MKTFFHTALIVLLAGAIFCVIACFGQLVGFGTPFASINDHRVKCEEKVKCDTIQTKLNATESRYMATDTFNVITSLTGFKNQTRLALNFDPRVLVDHNIPVQTYENGCFSYLFWNQVWVSMFDKFGNLCPISYAYVMR